MLIDVNYQIPSSAGREKPTPVHKTFLKTNNYSTIYNLLQTFEFWSLRHVEARRGKVADTNQRGVGLLVKILGSSKRCPRSRRFDFCWEGSDFLKRVNLRRLKNVFDPPKTS